jgi:hypothetical protein
METQQLEIEWLIAETQVLKEYCKTHNLQVRKAQTKLFYDSDEDGDPDTYDYTVRKYLSSDPPSEPEKQLKWWNRWNKIYNGLVTQHQDKLKRMQAEKEKEEQKKFNDACNQFWDSLQDHNYDMYIQLRKNSDKPHVQAEINKLMTQFVYSLLYEGKNLFDTNPYRH